MGNMRNDNILDLLKKEEDRAARRYHQGVIIQPGAIGDCILTLPLARFMKEALGLQSVDIIGHSGNISIFPGRTCIDKIRSMEAIPFHRLFADSRTFELDDQDPLITAFAPYDWIVTFLGGDETDFERNLIYAANCTSGTEVTSLDLKAPADQACSIAESHIRQFVEKNKEHLAPVVFDPAQELITPMRSDRSAGRSILADTGLVAGRTVIIQPGSGGSQKNWPVVNFISVASMLQDEGVGAVFLLGPTETEKLDASEMKLLTNTAPCLSDLILADVVAVLSQASAFLGNDSGITHLASGMGTPTIAVFGPAASLIYKPVGPKVDVVSMSAEEFARHDEESCRRIASRILCFPAR
jgi:ADP-heptose:LPS heptosyltransferase